MIGHTPTVSLSLDWLMARRPYERSRTWTLPWWLTIEHRKQGESCKVNIRGKISNLQQHGIHPASGSNLARDGSVRQFVKSDTVFFNIDDILDSVRLDCGTGLSDTAIPIVRGCLFYC
jgi:hypothetical protein